VIALLCLADHSPADPSSFEARLSFLRRREFVAIHLPGLLLTSMPSRPKRTLNADELQLENTALQRKLRQQERLIASLQRDLLPKSDESPGVPPTPLASGSLPLEPAVLERENAIVGADLELLGMANVPLSPSQLASSLVRDS